jgi:hypothetical protein
MLQKYLFEVYSNYKNIPFHNFRHAFSVTLMVLIIIFFKQSLKSAKH